MVSQGREMQGCERKTRLLTTEQTTWRPEAAVPSGRWERRAECKELKGDGGEEVGKGGTPYAALYKLGRKWTKRDKMVAGRRLKVKGGLVFQNGTLEELLVIQKFQSQALLSSCG